MVLRLIANWIKQTLFFCCRGRLKSNEAAFFVCHCLSQARPVPSCQKLLAIWHDVTFVAMTTLVLSPEAGGSALARDRSQTDGTSLLLVALLLLATLVFVYAAPWLRWFDSTAAVVDIGVLSLVWLTVVALILFLTASRWLLGLLWPVLRDYHKHHFSPNFKSLLPWQKITFYLVIYFGLLYAFVYCLCAVF